MDLLESLMKRALQLCSNHLVYVSRKARPEIANMRQRCLAVLLGEAKTKEIHAVFQTGFSRLRAVC